MYNVYCENIYNLIVDVELCKVRDVLGPLHQGVELLLPGELELGLDVCVCPDPRLVQLELVAHALGLQDALGGHVARTQVAVLVPILIAATRPHPLALGPLSLLLHQSELIIATVRCPPITAHPATILIIWTNQRRADLHGLPLHADGDALVVSAELAPVPLPLVDQAVPVLATRVGQLLPNCPLEKSLETRKILDYKTQKYLCRYEKYLWITLHPSQE